MRRRTLLAAAAGVASGLAGCIGDGTGGAGGETPTDTSGATDTPGGTATPTDPGGTGDTPTASPGGSPTVTGSEFAVTDRSCGTGRSEATVSRAGVTVTVDGTARGNNGCYTADLESAAFDGGELRVAVRTREERGETQACTQCIVDIDYEATVDYEGHLDRVVVTHDGQVVAERDY